MSFPEVFNAVALPFLLPKLRVFSGAPFLPAEKRAVNSLFDVLLARRGTALAGRKFVRSFEAPLGTALLVARRRP